MDVGVLNVQTERFRGDSPAATTPSRARSATSSRAPTSACSPSNRQSRASDYNRVIGADANFTVFKNTDIQGFIGRSDTPGKRRQRRGRAREIQLAVRPVRGVRRAPLHRPGLSARRRLRAPPRHPAHRHRVHLGAAARSASTSGTSSSAARWSTSPTPTQRLLTREQIFQATSRFQNDDALRFNATRDVRSRRRAVRDRDRASSCRPATTISSTLG